MNFKHIFIPFFQDINYDFSVAFAIDQDEDFTCYSFVLKSNKSSISLTLDEIDEIEKIVDDHFETGINPCLSSNESVYSWGSGHVYIHLSNGKIRFVEDSDSQEIIVDISSGWHSFIEEKKNIIIQKEG